MMDKLKQSSGDQISHFKDQKARKALFRSTIGSELAFNNITKSAIIEAVKKAKTMVPTETDDYYEFTPFKSGVGWRERPIIFVLMETMIDGGVLEKIKKRCGFENGMCISSRVVRDDMGELKAAAVKHIEPTSVVYAEAKAARYGLLIALGLGFDKVILKGERMFAEEEEDDEAIEVWWFTDFNETTAKAAIIMMEMRLGFEKQNRSERPLWTYGGNGGVALWWVAMDAMKMKLIDVVD
ncbi:Formamidopyrimidine-DNA glycosylase [Bienertia sinuspersici]